MNYDKNSHQITPSGTTAQPQQTVPDSNTASKYLKDALLNECLELVRLSEYDAKAGISFWPHVSSDCNDCGRCTNGARIIARKFGGFVAGYEIKDADPETLVGANVGGHDFAVVGDFIVDWWGWEYEESLKSPVLTIAEGIALWKYKPRQAWQYAPLFAFRELGNCSECDEFSKKPARISYVKWLAKYRPVANPLDSKPSFDGCMFETYGEELRFVCAQHPRSIWTLLDCDGKMRIAEGLHYVNRLGYFITEVAAPENRHFSIKAD
jgi:hypothetical protein